MSASFLNLSSRLSRDLIEPLYTERLELRAMSRRDAQDMFEYASLEEVTRYLLWSPHPNVSYTYRYLCQVQGTYRAGGYYDWAVVERATGKMIGTCGFASLDSTCGRGEIGYVIHPDFWRRGYATEAARAVIGYGFRTLALNRIEARYMVGNEVSRRVMEKCGMTFEGILRAYLYVKDRYRDIGVCAILRDEWENDTAQKIYK